MNNLKRVLSTSLAALLIAGSASMASFAKTYEDVKDDSIAKTEISILSDLGVILGTSENNFSPKDNVTREQMASLLFRLMLARDDAGRVNTTAFKDLYEPYYNGAISWANAAGYIKGVAEDRFNPTGGITKQDAMTMLVRALGQETDNMNHGYPWSYISTAVRLGLDKGLEDIGYTDTLTREETAKILFNALVSDYVVTKTAGNLTTSRVSTIIEEVFGYRILDAKVEATDDYALKGENTAFGFVRLTSTVDGKEVTMVISEKELGFDGNVNDALGMNYKLIYREKDGKQEVLSAVATAKTERHENLTVNKDGSVTIGDKKYTLAAGEAEAQDGKIVLYLHGDGCTLTPVTDAKELADKLGIVTVDLISDGGVAKRGIVKFWKLGTLTIDKDGKINLADGKGWNEIDTTIPNGIGNGDTVLYRYSKTAGVFEILSKPNEVSGTVMRLNAETVTIGEQTFLLGNDKAGISAESIAEKLRLGGKATVLVHNGAVLAIVEEKTEVQAGKYLLTVSDARLVYENGVFHYVAGAFVDGEEKIIKLSNPGVKAGEICRYHEVDGIYTLVPMTDGNGNILTGIGGFIQSEKEIGFLVNGAQTEDIKLTDGAVYTIESMGEIHSTNGKDIVKFLCNTDTVIVVRENGKLRQVSGKYAYGIHVNDGAKIVAVLTDEVGDVDTVKYLYVSDGSLGNYDMSGDTVRVLSQNGKVFANGGIYTEYTVFSMQERKVVTMLSKSEALTVGNDYRVGKDGTVTEENVSMLSEGQVNGYTAETVTIGDRTLTLSEDMNIVTIDKDGNCGTAEVKDLYGMNVEYLALNGNVTFLLIDANRNVD